MKRIVQFFPLVNVAADCISQYIVLHVHPVRFPKNRWWQPVLISMSCDLTTVSNLWLCALYFKYVQPFDSDVAYTIVFLLQVPIFWSYGLQNNFFWWSRVEALDLGVDPAERVMTWQAQTVRQVLIACYVSFTTYLAQDRIARLLCAGRRHCVRGGRPDPGIQ